VQAPINESGGNDTHDDRRAQDEAGEEVQHVVEPQRGVGIDRRELIRIHADTRPEFDAAEGLPGAVIPEARNDHAIREKSPDRSIYGKAIRPSKATGVKGVPLELAGADGVY
jgi:hypothetical protein